MNCRVCQKVFTGIENFKQHELSEKHKRKLFLHTRYRSFESVGACASTNTFPCKKFAMTMSETGLNSFGPRTSWQSRCEKCDKNFSGPKSYQQHIDSFDHKNKCGLLPPRELPEKQNDIVPSAWYCNVCHVHCTGIDPFRQHLVSKKHGKKVMREEAPTKLPGQISTLGNFLQNSGQVVSCTEIDGIERSNNATTGDLGREVKNFSYGDGWDTKICTLSHFNLIFFAVDEKINFDKNTKSEINVRDLDMVDVKEEEDKEIKE